ncbi:hypothetical protein AB5I41_05630 [Sphingomonas sp. MMS24-JH45]
MSIWPRSMRSAPTTRSMPVRAVAARAGQGGTRRRRSRRRDRFSRNRRGGRSAQPSSVHRHGGSGGDARPPGQGDPPLPRGVAAEPNDVVALAGQGEAMVAEGAVERARQEHPRA